MNPALSKLFVAPGPDFWNNHRAPTYALPSRFQYLNNVIGWLAAIWMYISRWSCRFCPTPARSATMGTPCSCKCAAGPIPDSISILGVLMDDDARMTSRRARMCCPPFRSTATARPSCMTTRSTNPRTKSQFARFKAGFRYAFAADQR